MRKKMVSVTAAFIAASLLMLPPASAMPSGGAMGNTGSNASIPRAAVVDDLRVTLEIPGDSSFLPDRFLSAGTAGKPKGRKNPVTLQAPVNGEDYAALPMAVIDGQPLTVGEYRKALIPELNEQGEIVATVARQAPLLLLDRLVNSRVMVREGREIGFDRLPEVIQMVQVFGRQQMRDLLVRQQLAGVQADPAEISRLYEETARESRIRAVLFDDEAEARSFYGQVQEGASFDELATRFAEADKGEIKGGADGEFVRHREMQPELAQAIAGIAPGQVTPVLPQQHRFAVIQFLEKRVPENPHLRQDAEQRALNFAGNMVLAAYNRELVEKYVTLDKALFESIDFSVDFEKLRQDGRILAEIRGAEPFTVGDLAEALRGQYYHGVQRAIDQGRLESDRIAVLNEELSKRAWLREAAEQGIDGTGEFRQLVEKYEDSVIFGAFVRKAVVPSIRISMDDLRDYYEQNRSEFSSPELIGLRSMAFNDMARAQEVLDGLRRGTDFRWLQSTAEGVVPRDTPGLIEFEGKLVSTRTLPPSMAESLAGAAPGQYRLYGDGKGLFYVLRVEQVVASQVEPFESVQSSILRTVFGRKMEQALSEWGEKLRKAYGVEVYVKGFNKTVL